VHEASWLGWKLVVKIVKSNNIHVLQKEVAILSKLRHPHIVLLVGFCVDDDKSMIVMEQLDGDLHQLIKEQGKNPPFPQHVAINIISQIAASMAYLHEKWHFPWRFKSIQCVGDPSWCPCFSENHRLWGITKYATHLHAMRNEDEW
jgi:serine/threonine protein kinase